MPYWCLVGVFLVRLADHRTRLGGRGGLAAGFLAILLLSAAVQPPLVMGLTLFIHRAFPPIGTYTTHLVAIAPTVEGWGTIALYHAWITSFYGGLLIAARIFASRAEHIRTLMHSSAMARSRTEALLDAERLQALQSQIDPTLLLDSMRDLEQRYRVAPERAERLLEALVGFLRVAMHGLRAPVSTVDAELKLARAFALLQSERGVRGAWRVVEDTPQAAHADLPARKFPSLLMLPLLALGEDNGRPLLRAVRDRGRTVISLHGLREQLPPMLGHQIRARLRVLYGENFGLESGSAGTHHLAITLREPWTLQGENVDATTPG